jgi:acetyl esterase/lipase
LTRNYRNPETQLDAETQAACLRGLERTDAIATAARASFLSAFTVGKGYSADADYSARAWLMHKTRITRGAAASYTAWANLAGRDPNQPLLSPAVCADLTGFPPILLQVGTNELLLDDSVRLAERARDADVDVILDITAGAPHVFQVFAGTLDEADQALGRAALFLTQHLAGKRAD